MENDSNQTELKEQKAERVGRWLLRGMGFLFLGTGAYISKNPEASPEHAALYCLLIGLVLFSTGQFASRRVVKACVGLLTGWP